MKKMKKLLAVMLALALMAGLAACGGSPAPTPAPAGDAAAPAESTAPAEEPAKALKIGVSLDTIDSDFWVSTIDNMNAAAAAAGAEVVQRLCEGDANKQNQQIEDLIAQGCDAIICGARDGGAIVAAVKKCNEAGVPIVMVSRAVMGDEALPSLQVLVDNISLASGSVEWVAQKAQEEGNDKAVRVFTRAKLAESVHAERYMEAYNNIDAADDDAYFLCPVCGYIEKGDDFEVCPICGAKKSAFKQF